VDAEQGVVTQHFNVPVLEVECVVIVGVVGGYAYGIEEARVVWSICDGEAG